MTDWPRSFIRIIKTEALIFLPYGIVMNLQDSLNDELKKIFSLPPFPDDAYIQLYTVKNQQTQTNKIILEEENKMKKAMAILAALVMVLTAAFSAMAEETTGPEFGKGVRFNMDMDQVMQLVNLPNPKIEKEKTRGTVEFYELEYENIQTGEGFACDAKYLFVGNSLVAMRIDMADGTSYEALRALLTEMYGEAVPFDAEKIGNGKYAIDDDGDLKDCKEMIEAQGFIVVLEQDNDGDVDITILDPTAAYINN